MDESKIIYKYSTKTGKFEVNWKEAGVNETVVDVLTQKIETYKKAYKNNLLKLSAIEANESDDAEQLLLDEGIV